LALKRKMKKFSCFEQFGALGKRMEASLGAYKIIEKNPPLLAFLIANIRIRTRNFPQSTIEN
jgi:hypothetical protein